jgi:hypothetical protein
MSDLKAEAARAQMQAEKEWSDKLRVSEPGRDERGHILDVFVDEQMTDAGRSAYWQAISEGATPHQAYNDAEAIEYQESLARRANVNNVPADAAGDRAVSGRG